MPNNRIEMNAPISRAPRVGCGSKARVAIADSMSRGASSLDSLETNRIYT